MRQRRYALAGGQVESAPDATSSRTPSVWRAPPPPVRRQSLTRWFSRCAAPAPARRRFPFLMTTCILAICPSDETPKESERILTFNKTASRDKSAERLEVRIVYIRQLQGTGDGLSFRAGGGNRRGRHGIAYAPCAHGTYR